MKMRTVVVLSIAVFALASCSAGGGAEPDPSGDAATPARGESSAPSPEQPETTPSGGSEDELETAVRAYSDAFFGGDATVAFGMLSPRCADETDLATFTGNLMAVQAVYGDAVPELRAVDVVVDGSAGRATYTYSDPQVNQTDQPWLYEGGSWLYDAC